MAQEIKRTPGWAGMLIGTLAIVIGANQLIQFAQFARTLHPLAGVVSKAIVNAVGEVSARSAAAAKDGITSRLQKIAGRAST